MAGCHCRELLTPGVEQGIGADNERAGALLDKCGERGVEVAFAAGVLDNDLEAKRARRGGQLATHHSITSSAREHPRFRRTGHYGISTAERPHSALMPANLITLAHFSVSSTMNIPSSAGEPRNIVQPRSASRACILASVRTASASLLRRPTISAGVFLRKPMANHWPAT